MSNQTKGFSFALTSAVLYGLIPLLGKKFVTDFPPLFVAFTVVLLAGFFVGVVAFWRKEIYKNGEGFMPTMIIIGFIGIENITI